MTAPNRPRGRQPRPKGSTQRHQWLVRACLEYLALEGIPVMPIQTTGIPVTVAGDWTRLKDNPEQRGMADFIAAIPPYGRLLWGECKTGNAVQTREQKSRASVFSKAGALVLVVRSVDDLMAAMAVYLTHARVSGGRKIDVQKG